MTLVRIFKVSSAAGEFSPGVDYSVNSIILDEEHSSGFIKGVTFGTLTPGVSVVKKLYLLNSGAVGDRMVDISIQSRSTNDFDATQDLEIQDVTETLRTLTVPTIEPLQVTQSVVYMRRSNKWPGLADLRSYDADFWDDRSGSEALIETTIECAGPLGLHIQSITLERQVRDYRGASKQTSLTTYTK
jgi:hypothetical protein